MKKVETAVQAQEAEKRAVKPTKITKLVLDGFKSFGKYTELLFGDDFNVIIGPNGSGKSNVLDALCFVLGKSSSKQLRAEKSANLIYNGGKTKQPAKAAEVSIVFDNSNNIFPIADAEVKLSRQVRMDGASKYRINNRAVTRQEILELLGSAKINPDGYNIILQGDIIRLVEMNPVERRQIIEEIAGIGMYEEKKQAALSELQKVGERLNEAEIILKEREGYLKDLKKDRDQALKYKELSDTIKKNKASYLKRQLDRKDGELSALQARSAKQREKLEDLNAQIKELRDEITKRKETIAELNREIERKGEVEQMKIQKEVENLRVLIATHKTQISASHAELNRLAKQKGQLESTIKSAEEKAGEVLQKRKDLQAQAEALDKTLKELESTIKAFRHKHNLAEEADIDCQFQELDRKAESKQLELQTLREKQQDLLREKDKAEFQRATIDEKVQQLKGVEDAHKEELEVLRKRKDEFKKLMLELNDLLNKDSRDANTLARYRVELQSLREEESKLAIKQASVEAHISANIAVKKVLEKRRQLGEIFGTIAELGSSEGKYALALEVAAANKIQSVVVDSDKTASSAIQFLRSEKLGVATFLPLNKVKPTPAKDEVEKLKKEKGVHGLAIELIDFDPKFKHVFSQVFGNTLVVDNIDTARRLGIGVARMVTLDGDLCELAGAMSGGFRQAKAGSFKEKEVTKKLEESREKIAELENSMADLESMRKMAEERISRVRELKAGLEGEIIKQEKSLQIDTGDLEGTRKYKEELGTTVKQLERELAVIDEKATEETQVLTALKIEKQTLRTKISELRNPRVLAELNAFEEKKKQLGEEKVRLEGEEKNLALQIEMHTHEKDNAHKLLAEMKKEEIVFITQAKELEKNTKEKEVELAQKEKEQASFFSQFKELFEKRNKIGDEVSASETKILGIEEGSRKEELTINLLSIEEAKHKAEVASIRMEFEAFSTVELDTEKSEEDLKKEVASAERTLASIGNVNMRALEIYDTVEKEYAGLTEKKQTLLKEKDDVLKLMNEIDLNKKELFIKTLNVIDDQFRMIFKRLMTKGESYLELENKEDPFAGGLFINVKITGNKFLDIRGLSGGEKTMTALAFLFALQEHEPAMFYILDEVDAALDKHNSEMLTKLIRSYCSKAQYIVISHNDALIAEGDILYGVSMNSEAGLSSVVGLKM
ncbi:MAG TPA: chromosome segregation protein SMC [Candidatus Nanoarchaeia archaeon]|nr:chromosome segregation protein SMC [Candidatus Nanoarchaeia archaeon]